MLGVCKKFYQKREKGFPIVIAQVQLERRMYRLGSFQYNHASLSVNGDNYATQQGEGN